MSLPTETTARPAGIRVTRSRRNVAWSRAVALVVVAVFARCRTRCTPAPPILDQAFVVFTLASMWNLLAGYGGLVSVGQQAFLGLGAYFVLIVAINGISPFLGLPVAAIGCGVVAVPLWWLVSRLRTGYFAIGTWVLATTITLIVEQFSSIGGGTGMPLPGLSAFGPALLTAYTYWAGLAVTVVALAAIYLLLRGRLGLVLTAIRDDEVAARSSGRGSAWPGCSCSWWRRGWARRAACWRSASSRCSRARCSACSGRPRWRSRPSSAGWARSGADPGHRGVHGAAADAGLVQRVVPDHPRHGRDRRSPCSPAAGLWGLVDERLNVRLFPVGYWLPATGKPPASRLLSRLRRAGP